MNGPHDISTLESTLDRVEQAWPGVKLQKGTKYKIDKSFRDADGHIHQEGDELTFIGATYLVYDEEVTLYVKSTDEQGWAIPLLWRASQQEDIIENTPSYFSPI